MNGLFVKALKKRFDMTKEDAASLAKTVEEIFDGEKEVEDMTIDKHARSLFYELHKENFLKVRREEYKENGKFMRKYYWSYNNNVIKEEAYRKPTVEDPYTIYQKIPRNAWIIRSYNT
jgi:hypothetical protein